ncbi:diguanylate cyclase [Seleniivibrio woodruffii]|uniref:GGDEF domain-containing response regulator n=1 Tax=Seleniivibrio woodruffii TaxID=1078050 RepID=UPI0026EDF985|nr:diguanylate cyclase [Seleniivibrio woodruffii]
MNVKSHLIRELSVLYVEDNSETAEAVRFTFENSLKSLKVLPTAEEAFEYFQAFRPDLVITESVLPFSDGIELTKRIKEISPDTPVLMISGHKDEKILLGSLDANVECYLMKPVNLRQMKKHIGLAAERIHRQQAAARSRNLLTRILDTSREMYMAGYGETVTYMNASLLEFFGFSSVVHTNGMTNVDVVENRRNDSPVPFPSWLKKVRGLGGFETVVSLMRRDMLKSDAKTYIARVTRIEEEDGFAISFIDVTMMESQKRFFHNLAMKDPLTDIFNRQKFSEELDREITRSRRYGIKLGLIMFDIDRFGDINDKFGQQAGDGLLKELSSLVGANIRTTDIFARYGGEEFLIMTPEVGMEGALKLAEKLRVSISGHEFENVGEVTCSFGVVQFSGEDADEFLKSADDALFRAKAKGRNIVSE